MTTERQTPDAAQGGADEPGKALVRRLLIEPLEAQGLARGRGVTQDAHRARLDRIAEKLAHMTAENLETLAEVAARNAVGAYSDTWPPEAAVVNWGLALQPRPPASHRVVWSWLESGRGPEARDGGFLVELHGFLCRRLVPPGPMDMIQIRRRGQDNRRTLEVYRERMRKGVATADECGWVDSYLKAEAEALALVERGEAKRKGQAA